MIELTYSHSTGPLTQHRKVYLPDPMFMRWEKDFIEEGASFPNGANDDQVDAMSQALLYWNIAPQQTIVYLNPPGSL